MSFIKSLREIYKKPKANLGQSYKERLIKLRKSPAIERIAKPTRLDRARALGYKAKQGYVVARVRVKAGGRKNTQMKGGRRSKAMGRRKIVGKSYQWIAEERAQRKYPNCEVLNSYEIAKDSIHKWYEVILLDKELVSKQKQMKFLKTEKGRVFRGKTAAGKRSRGILNKKGKGSEKLRPSLKSNKNRAK